MKSFRILLALALVLMMGHAAEAKGKKKKKDSSTSSSGSSGSGDSDTDSSGGSGGGGGRGYGVAGCGLGSIVFGAKPGMIQIVAATLNGTGVQTIGITAGTSNCDIPEMGHQAAAFIEVNKEIVKKDAARGNGEALENLAQILGCTNSESFNQMMQQNFENIFKSENSTYESTRQIINSIKQDAKLTSSCAALG